MWLVFKAPPCQLVLCKAWRVLIRMKMGWAGMCLPRMFASLLTKGVFFPFLMRSLSNFHLLPHRMKSREKSTQRLTGDCTPHSSKTVSGLRV